MYEEGRGSFNRKESVQYGEVNGARNGEESGADEPCRFDKRRLVRGEMQACDCDCGGNREYSARTTTRPNPWNTEQNGAPIGNGDANLISPTGI